MRHPAYLPTRRLSPAASPLLLIVVLLLVAVVIVIAGIVPRVRARTKLKDQTDALAAPTVIANPPKPGNTGQELILPGNIYAYSDASLYARTDGYLSKWYFDIGAHVRQGQLLAIISSPEVDKQLLQARADLTTAEANAGLAKTNAGRYQGLLTQNAVSKQDTDTFVSQAASTSSAVKSAQANVQRLEELQSFEKIYAPFSGVITARNVDVGQLINCREPARRCFASPPSTSCVSMSTFRRFIPRPRFPALQPAYVFRISRAVIYRQSGAHGESHRSQLTHPAGRNRCRQPEWQAHARRLRRSSHERA